MNGKQLRVVLERFTEKNDFKLNPDSKHVDGIIAGLLSNKKDFGLNLCPCRLRDGSRERDLALLCPCNFKVQETWPKQGRCWCGLFVKRD